MNETNLPFTFVKFFVMTSGASMRGTVSLILVKNIFNCFNFYSIDLLSRLGQLCDGSRLTTEFSRVLKQCRLLERNKYLKVSQRIRR